MQLLDFTWLSPPQHLMQFWSDTGGKLCLDIWNVSTIFWVNHISYQPFILTTSRKHLWLSYHLYPLCKTQWSTLSSWYSKNLLIITIYKTSLRMASFVFLSPQFALRSLPYRNSLGFFVSGWKRLSAVWHEWPFPFPLASKVSLILHFLVCLLLYIALPLFYLLQALSFW